MKKAAEECPACKPGKLCPKHCPKCIEGKCSAHSQTKKSSGLRAVVQEISIGQVMGDAFLDEMSKIGWDTGRSEEGAPGPREAAEAHHQDLERHHEDHKMVGSAHSDRIRHVIANLRRPTPWGMKTAAVTSVGYSKYFRNKMTTRGITSVTQLSEDEKKKFFKEVDTGYHSKREHVLGKDPGTSK
jgi:hypothetical protein